MTVEEALHICKLATKCAMFDQQCTDMTEFIDAMKQKYDLEMMVDCIQKQIPKKPIEKFAFSDDIEAGLCPLCNEGVNEEMNFCSYCGQAIDWEDE